LGNPNEFKAIKEIISGREIIMLEDNCESLGASFFGKQAGTFGLIGTFSSFYSHHIATMEGGCVVTDDEEIYHVLLCLRAHGWTRNLPKFNRVTGEKSECSFEESFKFVLPGYNVRPLEMSGAIGIEQLKKLPAFIEQRRNNALVFQSLFQDHPHIQIQREIGQSSWFGFSLVVREGASFTRDQLVVALENSSIECRPIVTGNFLKNLEVLRYFDYEISGQMTNAEYIDKNGLFVGNQQIDLTQQIQHLHRVIAGL
jgi:CDP-6-deoxy-D-xylo-4-hexulose-3-dehydrase